jgi:hypothetical protein
MSSSEMNLVAERADALATLVEIRLPIEVDPFGPQDAWPLVGPALLAHATQTMRSIILLEPRGFYNDGFRLLRSLYDHVVTFAWLAIELETRLTLWRLEDLGERLKADREASDSGEPLLDDAWREQIEMELAGSEAGTPDLASKAVATDRHWGPRVAVLAPQGEWSFRELYTYLFRNYSGLVHATFRGLNRVTEDLTPTGKRVVRQAPLTGRGPSGMATALHGLALFVAAETLGWPAAEEVHAVFECFPPNIAHVLGQTA